MASESFRQRLGFLDVACPRSFWIVAETPEQVSAATGVIAGLRRDYPRVRLAFASQRAGTRAWLAERYPDDVVVPLPFDLGPAVRTHMDRLKPRMMILLSTLDGVGPRLLGRLRWWRIPVVWLAMGDSGSAVPAGAAVQSVDRFFVPNHAAREALARLGVPPSKAVLPAGTTAVLQELSSLIRQDLKIKRSEDRPIRNALEALLLRALSGPLGRRLLSPWAERLDDLDAVAAALGRPKSIMCLGNGPSSEDPALQAMPYDCLFRVNDMWLDRGILANPHMVFTGDKRACRRLPNAAFAFQTARAEGRLVRAHIMAGRIRRLRYTVMERLGILFDGTDWGAKPTNGMAMIALAVALKPRRIVIGGMDLFAHPAGSYPGDSATANAYTPLHEKDVELRIIKHYLGQFDGEVEVVGDVLRRHLGSEDAADAAAGAG